ncbi:MAG: Hg(II)-responsive transcriptional regulator MerR [Dehalococcoidia bacterium]
MKIGELAQLTGVATRTIRYYESIGLLPSPPRDESGYRSYSDDDVRLLDFIQDAKKLALSLEEIGAIVSAMPRSGAPSCSHVLAMLEAKRREVAESIQRAERVRLLLDRTIADCRRDMATATSPEECCNIVERASRYAGDTPSTPPRLRDV